jgi:hypothetical protein
VKSTLHKNLRSSVVKGFPNFIEELSLAQNIGVFITFVSVKSAEPAFVDAYVCIVDVAVNDKTDNLFRMELLSGFIGHHAESE